MLNPSLLYKNKLFKKKQTRKVAKTLPNMSSRDKVAGKKKKRKAFEPDFPLLIFYVIFHFALTSCLKRRWHLMEAVLNKPSNIVSDMIQLRH